MHAYSMANTLLVEHPLRLSACCARVNKFGGPPPSSHVQGQVQVFLLAFRYIASLVLLILESLKELESASTVWRQCAFH